MKNVSEEYSLSIRLFFAILFVGFIIQNIDAMTNNDKFNYISPLLVALVSAIVSLFIKKK